jgi:exopolysaccharide biosynthesis polyprenyl glycosylphosphotransferase
MHVREQVVGDLLGGDVVAVRDRGWLRRYVGCLVAIDALAAVIAAITAYLVRFSAGATGYLAFSLALPALWVCGVWLARAYEPPVLGLGSEEFQRVAQAFVGLTAVVGFVSYASKAEVARGYVVLALPLAVALCLLGRYAARKRLHHLRQQGHCVHGVVAVGGEHSIVDLVTELRRERHAGMRVAGACLAAGGGRQLELLGVPVLGGLDDVVAAVRLCGADTVAVTSCADIDPARLRRLAWELEGTDTDLVVAPGLMEVAGPRLHIRPVTGLPLLHVEEPVFSGARRVIKGAVDRVVAGVALFFFMPLLLVIGAAIRVNSRGPAIFRQTRIGKDGRAFTMYKFRTMVVDAEALRAELALHNERAEGLLFKIRRDPRITPVGRVLRKYSLDELPQLVNVLLGDMSLVGPRPPLPEEVALYEADVRRRLLVKPGLTGLWQISGRSDLTWDESVRLDLRYVENWSLTLDFMILWKTAFAVGRGAGAY